MIKVMIIEDDFTVRDIKMKFVSKISGFRVICATGSKEEAKKKIKEHMPNVILLHMGLTKGNGLELLKWIRSKDLNCDVILITADKSSSAVQEAFRYGAVDYLIKPFTHRRFKTSLTQYKNRYENLRMHKEVQQDTIDKFVLKKTKAQVNVEEKSLPKGLNMYTYEQIVKAAIIKQEQFTADELSEEIGMARVTVRRYLQHMVMGNNLKLEVEYGKIGRPTHFYKI